MAIRSDDDYSNAPQLFKTFTGGTLRALESTDAPLNAQHLPCALLVSTGTTGNLVMKDANGVSNTIAMPANSVIYMRCAPSTLEAATAATITVTAFWQPLART